MGGFNSAFVSRPVGSTSYHSYGIPFFLFFSCCIGHVAEKPTALEKKKKRKKEKKKGRKKEKKKEKKRKEKRKKEKEKMKDKLPLKCKFMSWGTKRLKI